MNCARIFQLFITITFQGVVAEILNYEDEVKVCIREDESHDQSLACAYQPNEITHVDKRGGSSRAMGWDLSMPRGSPWCGNNQPTYWITGELHAIPYYFILVILIGINSTQFMQIYITLH